jgi:hypothetical protein
VDVLIESTKSFEKDLGSLSEDDKAITVKKINDCATLFPTQKADIYRQLHHLPLLSDLNGYESSLYTLKVSPKLRAILSVDEDPIFGQVIFTLFRAVKLDELDRAYKDVAESLYRELVRERQKSA